MAASSKRKLAELSVDEFLSSRFDSDAEENSEEGSIDPSENGTIGTRKQSKKDGSKSKAGIKSQPVGLKAKKGKASEHKDQLSRLKERDPEFYKFLEENDRTLLNFDDSDSSDEEGSLHMPPEELEEASEEEDEEDEKEEPTKQKKIDFVTVNLKMVEQWKAAAEKQLTAKLFHEITQAFKACVATAKGEGVGPDPSKYKVSDSTEKSKAPEDSGSGEEEGDEDEGAYEMDEEDDSEGEGTGTGHTEARKLLPRAELEQLAQGAEDMVEDLKFSDGD